MDESSLKKEYDSMWDKYEGTQFSDVLKRGFIFQYDEDETNCELLFIGINPAYKKQDPEERRSISRKETEFPYFKPFKEITKEINLRYNRSIKWTHIDLLVFRETKQDFIKNKLFTINVGLNFILDQLEIALKRIKHINPKVIVVSNALAREFLGKDRFERNGKVYAEWLNQKFDFDENLGTNRIVSLNNTPVFFTSMLSGQRALDLGSKERLIWHINRCLSSHT